MSECPVCCGMGTYPVIDKFGTERYSIRCPECYGSGKEGQEEAREAAENKRREADDFALRAKYEAAMAEKRNRPSPL